MSTNKTGNLGLHSWVRSDPFRMNEFNENFNKLDEAVGGNSAALEKKADKTELNSIDSTLQNVIALKADKSVLDTLAGQVAKKAEQSALDTLSGKVDKKAEQSALDTLAGQVAKKAEQSALNTLTQQVAKKAEQSALAAEETARKADVTRIDAALARKGNCRLETGTYIGTGTTGRLSAGNVLELETHPEILFVFGGSGYCAIFFKNCTTGFSFTSQDLRTLTVSWGENGKLTWYYGANGGHPGFQMNGTDMTYTYIGLYTA